MGRDVPRDDAACPDDGTFSDGDSGENDNPASQPASIADANRQGAGMAEVGATFRIPVVNESFLQIDWVGRRVDLHVGSDQNIVADPDFIAVYKRAIHVDRHIIAEVHIAAVIAEERC